MTKEQRRETRREIEVETLFAMDQCSRKIATVINISTSGMQLRYSPENHICHQWSHATIFASDGEWPLISNLACRPVYDLASLIENQCFTGAAVRICGVCFETITDEQSTGLNQLMKNIDTGGLSRGDG